MVLCLCSMMIICSLFVKLGTCSDGFLRSETTTCHVSHYFPIQGCHEIVKLIRQDISFEDEIINSLSLNLILSIKIFEIILNIAPQLRIIDQEIMRLTLTFISWGHWLFFGLSLFLNSCSSFSCCSRIFGMCFCCWWWHIIKIFIETYY